MQLSRPPLPILALGAILCLLSACTPTVESREITLTFDGESCIYAGPNVVSEGDVTIVLRNQTDLDASLWVVRLDEGKTWQDMLDYIGEPGANVHPPDWTSAGIIKSPSADNPDAMILTLSEGLYAICCCTCYEFIGPRGVWPGNSLEVRAE